jgi:1-deoxy-D-xylulose-5-phosphate reductoisomerase
MKRISVLGSTGSIGVSTLAAVESHPDRFEIVCLTAGRNIELLYRQAVSHRPALVCVALRSDAETLAAELPDTEVVWGAEGLLEAACHAQVEMVMVALVGAVGLAPTMAAIRASKHLALANKETLVVAGALVMAEAERAGIDLLPVDSEHSAIHQALRVGPEGTAARLVLTASGGPFRDWPEEKIATATVQDALAHPTWRMGPKITVDSATMMNKGLEIIEAHHLFGFPEERIDVLIHPQSVVHSLVEYVDGTSIAQLSTNDMRCPILYALSWPERFASSLEPFDLARSEPLSFEPPDEDRFPAMTLARAALRGGGEFPAVLNAANEVAVAAFLDGLCPLPAVAETVETTLESWTGRNRPLATIEQALDADREARRLAATALRKYGGDSNRSEIRC